MGLLLLEGGEAGSLFPTGWFRPSGFAMALVHQTSSGVNPRQDFNGNGGGWFFGYDNGASFGDYSKELARPTREIWIRLAAVRPSATGTTTHIDLGDSGGNNQVNIQQGGSATWSVRRNTTLLGTSPPDALPVGTSWVVFHIRVYIDNVAGEFEVFKNLDFGSPLISLTGIDTQNSTDNFVQFFRQTPVQSLYDGLCITDATVAFDTLAGTLNPGDTITGNVTGTTAVVTAIVQGSGSGPGVAQVHFVRVGGVAPWNDPAVDPWAGDTQLTNGLGWTGVVLAPLTTFRDANSGPEPDGLIFGLRPSGDVGGKIQLTRAGVDTGTNAGQVDAVPGDDATALQSSVETSTPGLRDMYEIQDTTAVGFGPGEIASVHGAMVNAFWQRDGAGLNNGNLIVEDLAVEYDGPDFALAVSPEGDTRLLNTVPDGSVVGIPWTEAKVNSLRVGIKLKG
jgi:hypothetical protein